ncbi:hypothetical protein Kpol_1025p24 [Vanderwaltozyma polyspora DSM 70294]|uniref:Ribosome biogenesis protein SLX9 n=1 Tax=Vanderwaltozyma polyspora (strain ATCC 22028 / DSM 70294 / BCRC 21397 / CBS 2163 / NBRC 10782 / NRRL Y-8283 / UCD 57-17) TaxID=436907 RepID=SLX9_VANPO|nr:uncharacterized protein Kpol_1025p24 [Vanderwaltozyma polyspora DSM 70294]A7TKU9.1 RecName: Full=Ribosome biogenesis protein SLX9 [Vanderwaltozyma polyspora DSM 70294]EDO17104.1 hypothetical protein Kpol_1025p24 [Vanderwaltozyma polyspora DSM 70294]
MVAKKRNTLRSKAAAGRNAKTSVLEDSVLNELPPDPKAFLHQHRESKRDKQNTKQQSFLSQIKNKSLGLDSNLAGISKSAARRRKRKIRDDLKPKMGELLTSLEKEEDLKEYTQDQDDSKDADGDEQMEISINNVTKITKSNKYGKLSHELPGSVKIKKNQPSIRNQKGAKQLAIDESKRFNQVLTNQSFQQNPFGSLREIIKMQK